MARRDWQEGISGLSALWLLLQGPVVAFLLWGAAGLLRSGGGWFGGPHDRALLWDDTAVAVGVTCAVPLVVGLVLKRTSVVVAEIVVAAIAGFALLALHSLG